MTNIMGIINGWINRYQTKRSAEDAKMISISINSKVKLFNRNNKDNPKWSSSLGMGNEENDGFQFCLEDLKLVVLAVIAVTLTFTIVKSIVDLICYKKRF